MTIENKFDRFEHTTSENIRFYESQLNQKAIEKCRLAEGTQIYVDLLSQEYQSMIREVKNE